MRRRFLLVPLLALLGACVMSPPQRFQQARTEARSAGLDYRAVPAGGFKLAAFYRLNDAQAPVRVYIEGDGHAWATRIRPATDPTPINPVALKLAARDPGPNVIYLGRPCQYLGVGTNPRCTRSQWTSARFSDAVVTTENRAITALVGERRGIELVGFSGGAAIAALVAARRDDVISLRTVAGNLDTGAFVALHHDSPMKGSLDPATVAKKLANTPQRLFIGSHDRIVPMAIARAWIRDSGSDRCIAVISVEGPSHDKGWVRRWPRLLRQPVHCR